MDFCKKIKNHAVEIGKLMLQNWKNKKEPRKPASKCEVLMSEKGSLKNPFLYDTTNQVKNQGGNEKMSMTIEQMRAEVAKLYSGYSWRDKVARMPDGQILAIYQKQVLNRANRQGGGKGGR